MKIILDKRKSKDAKISKKLKELGIGKSLQMGQISIY